MLGLRPAEITGGVALDDNALTTSICSKLVKADFSGGKIKVVQSKNRELIGFEGIIVSESARTFTVIQPDDSTKLLLKEGTVL